MDVPTFEGKIRLSFITTNGHTVVHNLKRYNSYQTQESEKESSRSTLCFVFIRVLNILLVPDADDGCKKRPLASVDAFSELPELPLTGMQTDST